jgi:hypothetical protein
MSIDVEANQRLLSICEQHGLDGYFFGGLTGPSSAWMVCAHAAHMESFKRYQDLMDEARDTAESYIMADLLGASGTVVEPDTLTLTPETAGRMQQEIDLLVAIGSLILVSPGVYRHVDLA